MSSPQIIAVVSGRNQRSNLETLLPTLAGNEYDKVFYLDDGSSDGSARLEVDGVTVKPGENDGASLNRNRILRHLADADPSTRLHFLDADVQPINPDSSTAQISAAAKVAHAFETRRDAFCIGGPVYQRRRSGDLAPMPWTYGPILSPHSVITGAMQLLAGADRGRFHRSLKGWPHDALTTPRQVGWVADANFALTLETLRKRPFEQRITTHAAQTFGRAALAAERKIWFDPLMPAVVQTAPQGVPPGKIFETFHLLTHR